MDFTTLFGIYYGLYRGEATPPASTDDEWKIAVRNYNDALQRMATFDDTKWNFFWSTLQDSAATKTLSTGVLTYTAPTNMLEPGGQMTFIDGNNNRTNYPIVFPEQVQLMSATTTYGYFTGDRNTGFTLHVNPAPDATNNGFGLDYQYYEKPTLLDPDTETGTSIVPGGDPAFYYNHMLANRFRVSRNWPAYQTAKRDAEEALKGMKLKNNSGSFYGAWGVSDTGAGFGV